MGTRVERRLLGTAMIDTDGKPGVDTRVEIWGNVVVDDGQPDRILRVIDYMIDDQIDGKLDPKARTVSMPAYRALVDEAVFEAIYVESRFVDLEAADQSTDYERIRRLDPELRRMILLYSGATPS